MSPVRYVGAAVLAVMMGLLPASPARAHDGPVTVAVAGDGAGGVTVLATYEQDKHPVEDAMNLVLVATGDGGRSVGPIQLRPTAEGRGFYASGNILTPGPWEVTVTAPAPHPVKVTVTVDARVAPTPPPVQADSGLRRDADRPTGSTWLWWLAAAVLIGLAAMALLALRRRRPGRSGRPPADVA